MNLLRRLLGVLVLLLSTVCFIGCIAAIVGTWTTRQDLAEKTRTIFGRLEVGLERASTVNRNVGQALEKARVDVAKVEREWVDFQKDEKTKRPPGAVRRLLWQEVGPRLNELSGRLEATADAAVVVHSLLQSHEELPVSQTLRISPARLERLTDRSAQLSDSVQKLQLLIGDKDREVAEGARQVDQVLKNCQTVVDEWQSDLDTAHAELPHFEAKVLGWITAMAIVVTTVCVWVALSQVSVFALALNWCRGRTTDRSKS
jgi:predicted PurR-regulated permease PerM